MVVPMALARFIALAVFAQASDALALGNDLNLMDAENATDLFQIASKDMENWHKTYIRALKELSDKMVPEHICPDVSVRLLDLKELEKQIEKIRECRQEKFEQLDVLKGIADTMGSLNETDSLKKLQDTIEHLNKTAHAEDVELQKEEDEVMGLRVTIENYECDCTYNSWGDWGSCSKTCGEGSIKSRSRDVRWNATNGGKECLEPDQDSSRCDTVCCPVDCTWEEWGEWSACPDKCGVSKVFSTREKNEHKCGGTPCTGPGRKEKQCDRFADLKMESDKCEQNLVNATSEIKRLNEKLCQNVSCLEGETCQEGECVPCNLCSYPDLCHEPLGPHCPSGQHCNMYGQCAKCLPPGESHC